MPIAASCEISAISGEGDDEEADSDSSERAITAYTVCPPTARLVIVFWHVDRISEGAHPITTTLGIQSS